MAASAMATTTTTTAAAPANDIGFLLAAGTGIAFVVGAACASCSRDASCSASLTRTLAFSTSTFVFIGGALGDILPFARGAFEKMQGTDHEAESRQHTARGLGQSFATASFVIGVVLQFSVNYVVARLLASATACHSASQLPGTQHTTTSSNQHVSLTIPAWMDSDSASTGGGVDFEPNSSGAVAFDAMQAVERVFEMSAAQSSKCADHDLSAKSKTYKRSLSVLAILAHHLPAGAIVYITAMVQPRLGQVLAFAVVLHSVPDGTSFAFSIHSANGCRSRTIVWSLLSPVGRCCGALLGFLLLREDESESAMTRCLLSGITAGGIAAIAMTQILPVAYADSAGRSYGVVLGVVVGVSLLALPKVFA